MKKFLKTEIVLTPKEAYPKIASYCAYQERSHKEVLEKLQEWSIDGEEAEELIVKLIQDYYLNESRFAEIYAGSKFRVKKWGKLKIKQGLLQKNVSKNNITAALNEIDSQEYLNCLAQLAQQKMNECLDSNPLKCKQKTFFYLSQKGFETHLIHEVLNNLE